MYDADDEYVRGIGQHVTRLYEWRWLNMTNELFASGRDGAYKIKGENRRKNNNPHEKEIWYYEKE